MELRLRLWLLVLVASAGLIPTRAVSAQSHADSAALMRALGAALRDEARRVLTAPRHGSADVLMAEMARAAEAALVPEAPEAIPPCRWGYEPPKTGAGFLVGIGEIHFDVGGDTARVLVLETCNNPPGYLHDIFAQDVEYRLARRPTSEWHVIGKRLTRIT